MTAVLPSKPAGGAVPAGGVPAGGNAIAPTPSGSNVLDFPTLILGAVIVGTSIYLVSEQSREAGWILTVLLLLAIGYAQKNFGSEIASLVSGQ